MSDPEGIRKLETILAADVAGYSRLMQGDDEATVATLEACRGIFRERIQAHRGRVVDMAGDSVLAVFDAATGAVRAAVEIQVALVERNETLPGARRMRFRIGVNLGEVIERPDGTVYGDGVNIAARLESLAEAGGICVSGTVYDQVATKLALGYEFLGQRTVKNITHPVRVYRIQTESGLSGPRRRWQNKFGTVPGSRIAFVLVGLLLLGGGIAIWRLSLRPSLPVAMAPGQRTAAP